MSTTPRQAAGRARSSTDPARSCPSPATAQEQWAYDIHLVLTNDYGAYCEIQNTVDVCALRGESRDETLRIVAKHIQELYEASVDSVSTPPGPAAAPTRSGTT
jgi:hypothetical protein